VELYKTSRPIEKYTCKHTENDWRSKGSVASLPALASQRRRLGSREEKYAGRATKRDHHRGGSNVPGQSSDKGDAARLRQNLMSSLVSVQHESNAHGWGGWNSTDETRQALIFRYCIPPHRRLWR